MKIDSLSTLNRSIKRNILLSLVALLTISLVILNLIYSSSLNQVKQNNRNEIISNFNLLKSNLSEKLSIIASSNFFIDYLRSGDLSQKTLKSELLFNIKSSKLKDISGIEISSTEKNVIFSEGIKSPYHVTLPLCYFDRVLDSKLGSCTNQMTLFFNKTELINSLKKINRNLISCASCSSINFLKSEKFGSFNIKNSTDLLLSFEIKNNERLNIITINILVFLFMIILGVWSWRRTNNILNKYISSPIQKITNKLKIHEDLAKNGEIEELSYLVDQIQERENKLKAIKDNENLIIVGKMASQVAHDIRSPLTIINEIVNQTESLPLHNLRLLQNATKQLTSIADDVLDQYRTGIAETLSVHKILVDKTFNVKAALDEILAEKEIEFRNLSIIFKFISPEETSFAQLNFSPTDFKRVISNIINNSVQAIGHDGVVHITLSKLPDFIVLEIQDSGAGIDPVLVDKIMLGEQFTSKKEGAGIGLSSSLNFIKLWGGTLKISSELNTGTLISIRLPIAKEKYFSNPDLILIDDNPLITDSWQFAAAHKNKKIIIFNNITDARNKITRFSLHIPIYIDSDLRADQRGEQYAKELHDLGYRNIFLTTGYQKSYFESMYWIKDIVSKVPAF